MSLAENVTALPQPRGGNYDLTRFNALRHGVSPPMLERLSHRKPTFWVLRHTVSDFEPR